MLNTIMRVVGVLLISLGIVALIAPMIRGVLPFLRDYDDLPLYAIGAWVMTLGIAAILACGDE